MYPINEIIDIWGSLHKCFWKNNYIYSHFELFFYIYLHERYTPIGVHFMNFEGTKRFIGIGFFNCKYRSLVIQSGTIYKNKNFNIQLQNNILNPIIHTIIIPIGVYSDSGFRGHAVVIIINKYLKTIEYYDSNGAKSYVHSTYFINAKKNKYNYVTDAYEILKHYFINLNWFKQQKFKFLDVFKTNPYIGIQSYGDGEKLKYILPKKIYRKGWCMIYSLIIIHFRILNIKTEPLIIQISLLDQIIDSDNYTKSVIKFLLNYLLYIKTSITEPKFIEMIYNSGKYKKIIPGIIAKKYIFS